VKTVVLIHGAGGGGWEWDHWKPVFTKAGWQFVAKDLVPAKAGLPATTVEDYAAQVVSWVPANAGPLVLVGASMGGVLSLMAAERLSGKRTISAVVLVNSVPPREVERPTLTEVKTYPEIVKWAGGPRKETADAMPDSDEKTIEFAWKRWRDESGKVMNALRAGIPVPAPKAPALVVIGEKDTDIAPATSRAIASYLKADVHEYAGMSHVGPLLGRRAGEVARATLAWIETRVAGGK
jgi:pimeloyl-ACP methyl ester carboxylesterase